LPAIPSARVSGNECEVSTGDSAFSNAICVPKKITSTSVSNYIRHLLHPSPTTKAERGKMSKLLERAFIAELTFRQRLTTLQHNLFARLKDDRGDVPGWVLVVLMTTGLVTAIWTIAAPRLTAILKNSLDSMNGIR